MFSVQKNDLSVYGIVMPGFEAIRDAFIESFLEGNEIGGACSLYVKGEVKVNIYAGFKNKEQDEWKEDTLVNVYSVTKVFTNLALAHLVDAGYCQYSDLVCTHWPEFASHGKEKITISQLVSHRAALPFFDKGSLSMNDIPDCLDSTSQKRKNFSTFLSSQTPKWPISNTTFGYHPHTVGFYVSELIRHIDPKKRCLSSYFREEIANQMNLDIHIGVRLSDEDVTKRLSRVFPPPKSEINDLTKQALSEPNMLSIKAYQSIAAFTPWKGRFLEIPSSVGFANANAVARVMDSIANQGAYKDNNRNSKRFLNSSTIEAMCLPLSVAHEDVILKEQRQYTQGGLCCDELVPLNANLHNNKIVWHRGFGGPIAYADLTQHFGFSITSNTQRFNSDEQYKTLLNAVYQCLEKVTNSNAKL